MTEYSDPTVQALMRAIYVGDCPAGILADRLLDLGVPDVKAAESLEPPIWAVFLPAHYYVGSGYGGGRGIGSGSGRGRGYGYGGGYGGIGVGIGNGGGSGGGVGNGMGAGDGVVMGAGAPRGRPYGSLTKEIIMQIGKVYLLETVDWFAWVGRVKRQIGPWEYEFQSLSKICQTNDGDNWEKLAAGDMAARLRATYRHYADDPEQPHILGLGVVAKLAWTGKTPQEALQ